MRHELSLPGPGPLAASACLAALALLCGCDEPAPAPTTQPAEEGPAVTYWRDARPLFDQKCNGCHTAGGIAPFSLESYEEASVFAGKIKTEVSAGRMPPWLAKDGCTAYVDDSSLEPAQLRTIVDWVDLGAPEGNPADFPQGLQADTGISRVDLTLPMKEPYSARIEPDDYRCFLLDWPETSVKYVTGFRASPGNPAVVHHVIAFAIPPQAAAEYEQLDLDEEGPGYTCFGSPGGSVRPRWIGAWAPGSPGSDMPPGIGLKLEPGSKVVLQVHYNSLNVGPQPDTTSVELKLDDAVEREGAILLWADPDWLRNDTMEIPAGATGVEHDYRLDPTPYMGLITGGVVPSGQPFEIFSASLHMHVRGRTGLLELERAGGEPECMLEIPRWDFHWQGSYGFESPKTFQPGDSLHLRCSWDNDAAAQPLVDGVPMPVQRVSWGEGTTDEMCLGLMLIAPPL